jgi:lipopolysaccharide transport system ATP-binding protein
MNNAIVVSGLSKEFQRYDPDRAWTLQETVMRAFRRRKPKEYFWALHDVSFDVPAGRSFGVIGANGSGKSTLLRILGGVMPPDSGSVKVNGKIGALLDLGAGFHHDLTGRENVLVSGVIGGLTRREVAERFDSIVAFAELGEFIDNPLRTYSTGMQMRLAFAIAVHVDPEVLLIDEVLSVGDISFQRKCLNRIARFKAEGCSIILVSHEASLIRDLCDEALWLSYGRLMAHGAAESVVDQYVRETDSEMRMRREVDVEKRHRGPAVRPVIRKSTGTESVLNENRFGSLELEITGVRLLDKHGRHTSELEGGNSLRIEIDYNASRPIVAPIFQVHILRDDGLVCLDLNTEATELKLSTVHDKGQVALNLERLDLNSGLYYVDVGAYSNDWTYTYDYHSSLYPLVINGDGSKSILCSPHKWDMGGLQLRAGLEALRAQ